MPGCISLLTGPTLGPRATHWTVSPGSWWLGIFLTVCPLLHIASQFSLHHFLTPFYDLLECFLLFSLEFLIAFDFFSYGEKYMPPLPTLKVSWFIPPHSVALKNFFNLFVFGCAEWILLLQWTGSRALRLQ